MTPRTIGRLTLAIAGVVVFGIGIRLGNANVRWLAIGLVAASWLLRFAREKPDD